MKSNIAKRGICIIAVSVLAACAQFGKQAPLEEPTVYSLPDGKSASLIQDGWWLQLKDNKLNQLVAQAIQTSTDLRIAKARFEQAQAQLGITEAAGKTQIGMSTRGVGMYVAPKPASSRIDTDHTLLLANAAVQGSWTFDFWGKNREQIAAVLGRRQAILYEAHQARIELANAVAKQYFIWQALSERQALVQERINLSEKMQQLVSRRIHANLMPAQSLYPLELASQQLQLEKRHWNNRLPKSDMLWQY